MKTITPTWESIIRIHAESYRNTGNPVALEEIVRCAQLADKWVAHCFQKSSDDGEPSLSVMNAAANIAVNLPGATRAMDLWPAIRHWPANVIKYAATRKSRVNFLFSDSCLDVKLKGTEKKLAKLINDLIK